MKINLDPPRITANRARHLTTATLCVLPFGGEITGAPGHNAVHIVLEDLAR